MLHLFISHHRPKRMRGSPSGRSWPWAASLTMDPASTPAAAKAASPACPHGNNFSNLLCNDLAFRKGTPQLFFFFLKQMFYLKKKNSRTINLKVDLIYWHEHQWWKNNSRETENDRKAGRNRRTQSATRSWSHFPHMCTHKHTYTHTSTHRGLPPPTLIPYWN